MTKYKIRDILPHALAVIVSLVFLDSLRFKFTNHPNTQAIFGKLDEWAASFGAEGLFDQTGLFSQHLIGVAELITSALLLAGIFPALRRLQALGALLGIAVMTGAINFHLWTPLGIKIDLFEKENGLWVQAPEPTASLFVMAVATWTSCLVILVLRRAQLMGILCGLKTTLFATATDCSKTN